MHVTAHIIYSRDGGKARIPELCHLIYRRVPKPAPKAQSLLNLCSQSVTVRCPNDPEYDSSFPHKRRLAARVTGRF
jgi:hypothetical protein